MIYFLINYLKLIIVKKLKPLVINTIKKSKEFQKVKNIVTLKKTLKSKNLLLNKIKILTILVQQLKLLNVEFIQMTNKLKY